MRLLGQPDGRAPLNQDLYARLHKELSRPRHLTAKTAGALAIRLEIADPLEGLATQRLESMEEWEVEVLISPLFTPGPQERLACEPALSPDGEPVAGLTEIVRRLVEEKVSCPVLFGEERATLRIPLVVLERYVRLLHADGSVPDVARERLGAMEEGLRHRLGCLLRLPVWRRADNQNLLAVCLPALVAGGEADPELFDFLGDFLRTYRPASVPVLLRGLENLVEAYGEDSPNRPVFDAHLAHHQSQAIPSSHTGAGVKARRLAMANTLLGVLNAARGQAS